MAATQGAVRQRRAVRSRTAEPRSFALRLLHASHARRARPWLGLVGLPLAVAAALPAGQWWALVPLGVCAWWWCPRDWGWEWLTAMQMGLVGGAWASVGADALVTWPDHRGLILAIWIDVAGVLGVASAVARYRSRRR